MLENNTIWDEVSADIENDLDGEPVYNKLKTKIKSHDNGVKYFYEKKNS